MKRFKKVDHSVVVATVEQHRQRAVAVVQRRRNGPPWWFAVPALILFAIVTAWTPPHFWALSLNYSSDYKRAGVPMLPVVSGPQETKRQILLYSIGLVAVSLLLAVWGDAGLVYLAAAAPLGIGFVYFAFRLLRSASAGASSDLFRYSIVYLALLFGAIALDALVGS